MQRLHQQGPAPEKPAHRERMQDEQRNKRRLKQQQKAPLTFIDLQKSAEPPKETIDLTQPNLNQHAATDWNYEELTFVTGQCTVKAVTGNVFSQGA